MKLEKTNLHRNHTRCQVNTQLTLEEDKNISDKNPDVTAILMEQGKILLDEVRPGKDQVFLKGRLLYEVLYSSEEEENRLSYLQGEIPFEEKVRAEGVDSMDTVEIKNKIEDMRSNMINSRKISIRALIDFCVIVEELQDEEIVQQISREEGIERKMETVEQSTLVVDCKDVFRVKEEWELPSSLPPVSNVLWKSLKLGKWEIRPLEDNISIQGELQLFLLYEGVGETRPIRTYETQIPFSGNVECIGSNNQLFLETTPQVHSWDFSLKEDYDGEERVLEVEMVLDLPIRLWETKEWEMVTDVYGTVQEVTPVFKVGSGKRMREKYQARVKTAKEIKTPASSPKILQICHVDSQVSVEETKKTQKGLEIEGVVFVTILYLTEDEKRPFETVKEEIPFLYEMENAEITDHSKWKVASYCEHCNGILLDEEHLEIKTVVGMEILFMEEWEQPVIEQLQIQPMNPEYQNKMPGIVVYIPNGEETVWNIGKKYITPIESIQSLNQLNGDVVKKGQKLLLVKEA